MKNLFLLIISTILLISCSKTEYRFEYELISEKEDPELLYGESFGTGTYSNTEDSEDFNVRLNRTAYVQEATCTESYPGYLTIGCAAPNPLPSNWPTGVRCCPSYTQKFVDTVKHYRYNYPLNQVTFTSDKVGIQIKYQLGGITDFHLGQFYISNEIPNQDLDNATLEFIFNLTTGELEASINNLDVSHLFLVENANSNDFSVIFRAKSTLTYNNGFPYINKSGLRISRISVYQF